MRTGKVFKIAALCALLAPLLAGRFVHAEEPEPFPHPPQLEPDVRFWIRVYTEVTTDGGLIHDDWNLKLVYEVLRFDPDSSPAQRERRVAEAKTRYAALLKRFAAGQTTGLSAHERRILHAFGANATPRDYLDAIDRIRFQLGQADRFHEGLIRAEAWETHIARVLREHGVPAEIAALPHVESSFNPAAYSKAGAAGLWQFMPSTAKRFMRVDSIVDERLDPYSATEAAANLMLYNYRLLGSWPLAVTAYNHGPAGLRRAQDQLGTSDIAVIVKRYQGATFGFASRNFYVAFLAALEVDRNAEKYFGPLTRLPDTENTPVELPDYIAVDTLAKAFRVDLGALKVLNPALRPPIWNGARLVPRGYALRIPGVATQSEIAAAWGRVPTTQRYVAQRNDGSHRVRKGETLAGIAAASGMSVARLLAANGWSGAHAVVRGEVVRIPLPATRAEASGQAPASLAANLTPPLSTSAVSTSAGSTPAESIAGAPTGSSRGGSTAALSTAAAPVTTKGSSVAGSAAAVSTTAESTAPRPVTTTGSSMAGSTAAPSTAGVSTRAGSTGVPSTAAVSTAAVSTAAAAPRSPNGAQGAHPAAQSASPSTQNAAAPAAQKVTAPPREPVTRSQTESAALLPAGPPTGGTDTTDYGVAADDTVVVQVGETLGHFSEWSGVDSQRLRALNRLHQNARVTVGRKIKLDLSKVTAEQFSAARREYHHHLQEEFFAAHRIAGTESYVVKRGESLWTIAQLHADLPVWLVAQYNPDVNFSDIRPGTTIALPEVVDINRQ